MYLTEKIEAGMDKNEIMKIKKAANKSILKDSPPTKGSPGNSKANPRPVRRTAKEKITPARAPKMAKICAV